MDRGCIVADWPRLRESSALLLTRQPRLCERERRLGKVVGYLEDDPGRLCEVPPVCQQVDDPTRESVTRHGYDAP
jgi:hypothetical protein